MPPRGPPPMRSAGSAQSMSQNAPQSGRNLRKFVMIMQTMKKDLVNIANCTTAPRGPPRGPPGASVRGGPPPGLVAGRGPPRGAPPAGPPLRNQGGQTFGTLALIIMQGKNLPVKGNDTKVYVTAKLYNEEHSTEVASKNVENPTFGDKFTWKIDSQAQDTKISFRAFKKDANTGKDQLLGGGSISYLPWIVQQEFEGDISLKNSQEKPVGTLKIHAVFEKPGQATIKSGNGNEVPRGPNEKFTDEEIREAFIAFDLDNNNYVGPAEIRHILVNIGENPSDAEIDEMIRMVDKAGDGQISYEEFYAMVTGGKQQQQQQRSTTSPLVGDRSGLPSPSAQPGARAPTGTAPKIQKRNARQSALDEFAKQNHLDPDSIKKAYSRFQQSDKSGEGLIEYSEFCEILQIEPGPLADRLFKLFDKDTSGKIDVKEFMVGLSNFTGASKDEKLRFAFAIYDEENKNSINKEQLVRILMANHLASSEDEVQRKADTIMGQADKEGKGRLSFDDFAYISEKFPNILYPAFNLQQSLSSVMTK